MAHIGKAGKLPYCPLKPNRKKVDGSGGKNPHKAVSGPGWSDDENRRGKLVKVHGFPLGHKVKLFRVAATSRTEYIVTNDPSQDSAVAAKDMCGIRWKIEQYHREGKQVLGLENANAARPAPRETTSAAQCSLGTAWPSLPENPEHASTH